MSANKVIVEGLGELFTGPLACLVSVSGARRWPMRQDNDARD
jgi:hypothetical protein